MCQHTSNLGHQNLFLGQLGPHVQCNSGQQSIQLAYKNFLPLLDVIDISPFQAICHISDLRPHPDLSISKHLLDSTWTHHYLCVNIYSLSLSFIFLLYDFLSSHHYTIIPSSIDYLCTLCPLHMTPIGYYHHMMRLPPYYLIIDSNPSITTEALAHYRYLTLD